MYNYTVSAVINDRYCEDTVQAVSDRQAWFKFAKKYGFKMRNFVVMGQTPVATNINTNLEQIRFDI